MSVFDLTLVALDMKVTTSDEDVALSADAAERDLRDIEHSSDLCGAVPEVLQALGKLTEEYISSLKIMKDRAEAVVTFWEDPLDGEAALAADRATVGSPEQPL